MKNKNKVMMLASIIIGVLVVTLSLTYAVMSFDQTGRNSQLVLGDIWMKYSESMGINIENAMPGAPYTNYFEFTITGKNTYTKKDIYYDFSLTRGDTPTGKSEVNRIPDKYLKFKLVSVDENDQEIVLLNDKTYSNLSDKRIYVETISKNTTGEINRKYRLYMTIDNTLLIGNVESAVFTAEEWAEAFASIRVNVSGDFTEKELESFNDCFETTTKSDGTLEITNYYTYYGYMDEDWQEEYIDNELYQNPLCITDVVIPSSIKGVNITSIGTSAFEYKGLTSVSFPETLISIGDYAFSSNSLETVTLSNSVTTLGAYVFDDNGNYNGNDGGNTTINIGNQIQYISEGTIIDGNGFGTNATVNIDKTCAEIEQIAISSTNTTSAYPWSTFFSFYTLNGTDGVCYSDDGGLQGGGIGGGDL